MSLYLLTLLRLLETMNNTPINNSSTLISINSLFQLHHITIQIIWREGMKSCFSIINQFGMCLLSLTKSANWLLKRIIKLKIAHTSNSSFRILLSSIILIRKSNLPILPLNNILCIACSHIAMILFCIITLLFVIKTMNHAIN